MPEGRLSPDQSVRSPLAGRWRSSGGIYRHAAVKRPAVPVEDIARRIAAQDGLELTA
jgi:hypothetical protein